MKDISSVATFLIACLSETLCYGIALVLFINSLRTILKTRRNAERANRPLLISAPFLFALATLHVFGVWVRTFKGFVSYPEGPAAYFSLITSVEKTITQVGQVGAVVLADAMTIYRTWTVWNKKYWPIIVPGLTFVATVVCAAAFITVQHQVNVHTSIFSAIVTKWTEAFLGASLATTGMCTFLIVFKLLRLQRELGQGDLSHKSRSLTRCVLAIVIESAALYSLNNLMYSVLYSVKLNPEAWFSGLDAPVASITFSLLIIRIETAVNVPLSEAASDQSSIHVFTSHELLSHQEIHVNIPVSQSRNPEKKQTGARGSTILSPRKLESYNPEDVPRVA